jgi:hypothetical protein
MANFGEERSSKIQDTRISKLSAKYNNYIELK